MKIGIISDTHDLLRPEVVSILTGVDAILHAGDISSQGILDQLQAIAPVYAVRGNADKEWAENLPFYLDFELGGLRFFMTHKKKDLPEDLSLYDFVIVGHSHQYSERWMTSVQKKRTLILNPGSCGPRRFLQPVTMAVLTVDAGRWAMKRIEILHSSLIPKIDPLDIRTQIEICMKEIQKGHGPEKIAEKYGMDPAVAEQIVRLYLTHPGVTVDGIMTKMGL